LTIPPPIVFDEDVPEAEKKRRLAHHRPKITALGKIFVNLPVDLKIARLFLFGMALKCMRQAIYLGCIHA
jgi:hypothetical protein